MMNVLVIGSGAREHAIVWKLAQSPKVSRLFCAPGNSGMTLVRATECVDISVTDFDGLTRFAIDNDVDLTVVGPETPLIAGIVDAFEAHGLRIFGPSKEPAQIEGSKAYCKELMRKYSIPTADYILQNRYEDALGYAREYFQLNEKKLVVKADGEAAGKGVFVCSTFAEAERALTRVMLDREFGASGDRVLLEEGLDGYEITLMAFTDGVTVVPMPVIQDHKRLLDHDKGPNTGGMGCYGPVPFVTPEFAQYLYDSTIKPAIAAVKDTGIPYKGVIYAGLMIEPDGAFKVLEFNARFGDPETQVVLPLLETDLVDILVSVADARLHEINVQWRYGDAVCVVMSSAGYPGPYGTGYVIEGLEQVAHLSDVVLFHAATTKRADGQFVTDGGRVLSATAVGEDFEQARARAYAAVRAVSFEGAHYRTDIGYQAALHEERAAAADIQVAP